MDAQNQLEDLAGRIRPQSASHLLLWVIAAALLITIIWAAFTELDRSVRAPGRVVPSAQLQIVSNLEGGLVRAILVRTGQTVKQGAPLLHLDQTQTGADLGSGQATLSALQAKVARLEAEVSGRSPRWPSVSDGLDPTVAERQLYASRMAEFANLGAARRARISQAEEAVIEARSALEVRAAARRATDAERAIVRQLVAKGIESELTLIRADAAASSAVSEYAAATAALARAQSAVREVAASQAQAQQEWRARASDEFTAAQAELSARMQALPALADRLRRTIVRAPLAGKVNRVLVTTVGGTVRSGEPLVEIVPNNEVLVVEALVSPKDVAAVRIGQKAKIGITAYDSGIYGRMDGEVITLSPDATVNERTGETHYTVKVRTAGRPLIGPDGRPVRIGPGMVAEVSLLGEKRSVLSYLLTPITRLSETAFRE